MLGYLIVLGRDLKKNSLSWARENTTMALLGKVSGIRGEQQSKLSPIGSERRGTIVGQSDYA